MQDHVTVIYDHPAVTGEALFFALLFVIGADIVDRGVGERVYHAVAGAGADNKIIGE